MSTIDEASPYGWSRRARRERGWFRRLISSVERLEKQAGPWDAPHHVRRILDRADAIVGPPEEIGLTAKWLVMGQLDEVDEKRVMRLLTVDYERRALHTNCRRPGSVIKSLMDAKKRGRRRVMRYRRLGGRSFARLLAMQHPWWFT